ncbi:TonB-dependent receptor [Calditerrivibrio nitroreducens]|uniref:TonB-dependent receptor plug n=1 Tax=Calditerrivibrio nitroreducens (strain DSM 19672 / NBRC 101217 / Yu37-1) TaxID=768670 RepID=E4TGY5_CALNY|nr:TonB-dependent receptor [Calditerrivibrio nitroreducens]ADR19783.1 TonB-dependent receptor plug [Calditerrivibrio nitroreducens DSM 19672]
MKKFSFLAVIILILPIYIFANEIKSITVFGDKITEKDAQNQANIIILTYEDIQKLNPADTYDLLEKISGINIKSYDKKNVTVNIGGFVGDKAGLNNVIMVNGRKITNPDMSNPDLTLIPVDTIDRVEVYLGGNSVLFGDRATGGAINIITKKPVKNSFKAKVSGGSYGLYDAYAEGVMAKENYSFLLSGNKFGTQGYRDNSELYSGTINTEFSYFTDKFEITLNGIYTDSKYGFPGSLTPDNISQYGRKHTNTPKDGGHDYESLIGLKISYDTGSFGKFFFDTSYKDRNRDYDLWGKTEDELETYATSIKYEHIFEKKHYKNRLITGIDFEEYDLSKVSSYPNNALKRSVYSLYLFDQIDIYKLYINAGVRYSKLNDDYTSQKLSKDMSATAYTTTLGFNIDKNQTIYLKYDKSYRFPTTDEIKEEFSGLLNTQITKQESTSYEIGYRWNKESYYLSTSAYKQTSDNEIFSNPDWNWWSTDPANINLNTRKYVFNLNGGYSDKKFMLNGSYNYIDSKITEKEYYGKIAPLVSTHNIKGSVGYRFNNGIGLFYDIRYYSSYYKGNDYKNIDGKMGGYAVSDVKIDFVRKNYELFLKINNIFDKEYYDYVYYSSSGNRYYPSPTRNILAGGSIKF